jgi:hypothetical protein
MNGWHVEERSRSPESDRHAVQDAPQSQPQYVRNDDYIEDLVRVLAMRTIDFFISPHEGTPFSTGNGSGRSILVREAMRFGRSAEAAALRLKDVDPEQGEVAWPMQEATVRDELSRCVAAPALGFESR